MPQTGQPAPDFTAVDPAGIIRKVFTKVDVEKHGDEVLAAIRAGI